MPVHSSGRDIDDEVAEKVQTPILAETVIAFITEKSGSKDLPCPVCGVDDWDVSGTLHKSELAMSAGVPDDELKNYLPVVIISCTNCGLTRLFNRDPIARWEINRRG
ncbi:hypothetical protein [Mesorhizobium sp. LNJC405B00]|uniref:hypothetical protein n=1 Tax=unclassified Mesorhizobium TaxID=325217 RepID=UPI0003CEE3E4|nr:hypothetical protein [Mesorhizobium sp. LNJC405B00]ESX96007.1 hypothetical protein X755_21000 [Mesorhizobium sp. LNJC405B00]